MLDDRGVAAFGWRPVAAKAGIAGNTARVAAVTGVRCRNERRVRFVTVLSFYCGVVRLRPANVATSGGIAAGGGVKQKVPDPIVALLAAARVVALPLYGPGVPMDAGVRDLFDRYASQARDRDPWTASRRKRRVSGAGYVAIAAAAEILSDYVAAGRAPQCRKRSPPAAARIASWRVPA
jgi:hypothetical protein